jgi:hypothetical protein
MYHIVNYRKIYIIIMDITVALDLDLSAIANVYTAPIPQKIA